MMPAAIFRASSGKSWGRSPSPRPSEKGKARGAIESGSHRRADQRRDPIYDLRSLECREGRTATVFCGARDYHQVSPTSLASVFPHVSVYRSEVVVDATAIPLP